MKASTQIGSGVVAIAAAMAMGIPTASTALAGQGTAAQGSLTADRVSVAVVTPAWPVLREGRNAQFPLVTVRSLQYLLDAHGARLVVDGIFGPRTNAAVVAFQRAHGLQPSGVVQASTWRALIITVRYGSQGNAVRAVQDQANFRNLKNGRSLVVDGIFGPKTRAWVIGFQTAMRSEEPGFLVDGIVGPQTWSALVSEALSG